MKQYYFRVSILASGKEDEHGLKTLRISFKPYIRDAFDLGIGDVLEVSVVGIYENKKAKEYEAREFKLNGKVSTIGGKKTVGMTIEKDEARRQGLTETNELEISVEVISRAKERRKKPKNNNP